MIIERWAFSRDELDHADDCDGSDELVAYIDVDDDGNGTEGFGIVVYRNGEVSNRFDDGTVGVPKEFAALANDCESLVHPDGNETDAWCDVEVDKETGRFIRFHVES